MQKQLVLTLIGATVNYYRNAPDLATKENEFIDGRGVIVSAFLNPDMKPMVQIEDAGKRFNVDLAMINASEDQKKAFRDMHEMVDKLVKEHDAKALELQKDYNNMIAAAYTAVLGEGVELVEVDNDLPA